MKQNTTPAGEAIDERTRAAEEALAEIADGTERSPMKWQALARQGKLAETIVEYVRALDWVTLVELQHKLEPYFPVRGAHALCVGEHLMLWDGMSEELVGTLQRLYAERRLFPHPTTPLTYFIDGGGCRLPVANRIPKGGYKTNHWLPVCLRVVPWAEKKRQAA